jgi:hypothetical protein
VGEAKAAIEYSMLTEDVHMGELVMSHWAVKGDVAANAVW